MLQLVYIANVPRLFIDQHSLIVKTEGLRPVRVASKPEVE